MANIKISELPIGVPDSTSIFPFVSSGTTYKGQVSDLKIPSVQTIGSAGVVTPTSSDNLVIITGQTTGLTLNNPTGVWNQGQDLMIRIKDDGISRSISYDTNYRPIGVTLPTNTIANKTIYLGMIYNSTDGKWDIIGVAIQS